MDKLSILCPGIRPHNWVRLFNSIKQSWSGEFELIFCGPYYPPEELQKEKSVKFIQDYGSPTRCQQIALLFATGNILTFAADDGWFIPGGLDRAVNRFLGCASMSNNPCVLSCYYKEGTGIDMQSEKYYTMSSACGLKAKYIPDNYKVINVGIMHTNFCKDIGGWDSQFAVATIAHMDFAVRVQRGGYDVMMYNEQIFHCEHMPEKSGDHGPIHDEHLNISEPNFRALYSNEESNNRQVIKLYNCFDVSPIWQRRFK